MKRYDILTSRPSWNSVTLTKFMFVQLQNVFLKFATLYFSNFGARYTRLVYNRAKMWHYGDVKSPKAKARVLRRRPKAESQVTKSNDPMIQFLTIDG